MKIASLAIVTSSFGVVCWMGWHWWPHWGLAFAAEDAPLAWWQAALLVANATGAGALASVHAAVDNRSAAARRWALLAIGMLGAALDERFMAHEALQEWLQFDLALPQGVAQGVILVYALGGLVLVKIIRDEGSPALQRWGLAALLAAGTALTLDLAFDTVAMQIVEELVEALAETLLLAGLFSELGSAATRRR